MNQVLYGESNLFQASIMQDHITPSLFG